MLWTSNLLCLPGRGDFSCTEARNFKVFASRERVSSFPAAEKGADLRGSPGNFRGSSGNFRGSLGNFRGTPGLLLSSTVRELPGKSPKTSGEVWGTSGEVRGLSRSSGELDSLTATRQISKQTEARNSRICSESVSRVGKDLAPYRIGKHSNPQNSPKILQKYSKNTISVFLGIFALLCLWGRFPIL